MCGLIFVHRAEEKPAQKMVLKRYHKQKTRGSSGFGFISFDLAGVLKSWKRAQYEADIKEGLAETQEPNILFHHRQPTSTPNLVEATHPIKVSNELLEHDYYVIHNGVITNDDDLKTAHEKLGFKYTTEIKQKYITNETVYQSTMFNDSESLAVEVALAVEDSQKVKIDTKGSVAFIALQVDKQTQKVKAVYFGRNFSNPLLLNDKREFFTLTSEGDGEIVAANLLHRYDIESKLFSSKKIDIGVSAYSTDHYGNGYTQSTKRDYSDAEWDAYFDDLGYRRTGFNTYKRRESGIYAPADIELPRLPTGKRDSFDVNAGKEFDDSKLNDEIGAYIIENDLADDEDGFTIEPEDVLIDLYEELEEARDMLKQAEAHGNAEDATEQLRRFNDIQVHIGKIEAALDDRDLVNDIREEVMTRQAEAMPPYNLDDDTD